MDTKSKRKRTRSNIERHDALTATIRKKLVRIYKRDKVEEILRPKTNQSIYVSRPDKPRSRPVSRDVSRDVSRRGSHRAKTSFDHCPEESVER